MYRRFEVVVQANMSNVLIVVHETQSKDPVCLAEVCVDHICTWQPFWMLRHVVSICHCCNA